MPLDRWGEFKIGEATRFCIPLFHVYLGFQLVVNLRKVLSVGDACVSSLIAIAQQLLEQGAMSTALEQLDAGIHESRTEAAQLFAKKLQSPFHSAVKQCGPIYRTEDLKIIIVMRQLMDSGFQTGAFNSFQQLKTKQESEPREACTCWPAVWLQ